MNALFSMQGRIGRKTYVLLLLLAEAVYLASSFTLGFIFAVVRPDLFTTEEPSSFSSVLVFLAYLPSLHIIVAAQVKRLHDLNRPGSHLRLHLSAIFGFDLELALLLKPGTEGANCYGPNPKQPSSQGALTA